MKNNPIIKRVAGGSFGNITKIHRIFRLFFVLMYKAESTGKKKPVPEHRRTDSNVLLLS